jgi:DNA mismatch endonuclease, patch repair protein
MTDRISKYQRRKNMQAVKSKDSKIEIKLRKALWQQGIRYRKNFRLWFGVPDIAITKYNIAIFCDSEFWHGYDWKNKKHDIKSNKDFWITKIERNIERDSEVNKELKQSGIFVLRFWGNEINKNLDNCVMKIISSIKKMK